MSAQYNVAKTTGVFGGYQSSAIGAREQINHPKNCNEECPYGYDRAFCFPCYKKLMSEMPLKKRG